MRVCFGTLCFSSRLDTADEEATATTITANNSSQPTNGLNQNSAQITSNGMTEITAADEELRNLLQQKEEKIKELESLIKSKDEEIVELRSHLDKFKSVFPLYNPTSPKHLNNNIGLRPRKQRAGISAEPQSETSLLELSRQTFKTFEKEER